LTGFYLDKVLVRLSLFLASVRTMSERVKRRLTTILCADVEGYSRLMEADEQATLGSLRRHRAAMVALVERHDGRIVNTWGDAVIAEFSSVVEAVQCAAEVQQELSGYDRDRPEGQRIKFRIGINLGDVMVEGADIYGDGINVAARLQELAEPGGILISGPVYDQVRNKLPIAFEYLGNQQVKNLTTPDLSYRVTLGQPSNKDRAAPHQPQQAEKPARMNSARVRDGRPIPFGLASSGYPVQSRCCCCWQPSFLS
jgi:adenylate cyclase